jgi:hypothetical protein
MNRPTASALCASGAIGSGRNQNAIAPAASCEQAGRTQIGGDRGRRRRPGGPDGPVDHLQWSNHLLSVPSAAGRASLGVFCVLCDEGRGM